ncbi:hypothetical protein ACHWQZ_G001244 [Mnemiopsis leidyi]
MGAFLGHALPGAVFYLTGFWSLVNVLRIVVTGAPFLHRFWYPIDVRLTKKPVEPIIKIFVCIIGVLIEMGHSARWHIHDQAGNFINMNDLQHSTMYIAFIIASFVDILSEKSSKLHGLDAFCYFVCFTGEAFLFYFHLHGREMVDVQIHLCLVVASAMCGFIAVVARWKSSYPIISITYSLFVMLHGTWFLQAGFLMYPPFHEDTPAVNLMDPGAMMYVTNLFLAHLLVLMVLLLLLYFVFRLITPSVKQQKHYVKHQKSELGSPMYKTVPSSVHFYVDSD